MTADVQRPRLVLVGGAPGSGKTTLAARLVAELRVPLLMRDELKEAMANDLPAANPEESARLGAAAYGVLYVAARRMLLAGVGLVMESNFHRGRSEQDIRPLLDLADAVLIHCGGDPSEIARRFIARAGSEGRHPVHHDLQVVDRLEARLRGAIFEPLDLEIPVLRVATTGPELYEPGLAQIVAFARG
ncbi:MAG: AAA family ATPase [Chloroflexota bacterium]